MEVYIKIHGQSVNVEVSVKVGEYLHRAWYHKAYYSLDRNDGIENSILHTEPSPEEILMKKVSMQQLFLTPFLTESQTPLLFTPSARAISTFFIPRM